MLKKHSLKTNQIEVDTACCTKRKIARFLPHSMGTWLRTCSFRAMCLLSMLLVTLRKTLQRSGNSGHTLSHIQTFLFSSLYLISFHQGIQGYHQKFKKILVNVPKSHLPLYYNSKKNTLWNIKRISLCNDGIVEPPCSIEAIFDIIGTFGTIQPWSEPTILFQYMSSVG